MVTPPARRISKQNHTHSRSCAGAVFGADSHPKPCAVEGRVLAPGVGHRRNARRDAHVTASGVIFASLEDETGLANVNIWPKIFEANRRVVLGSRMMAMRGEVQKEGLVVHVIAREVYDMIRPSSPSPAATTSR